MFIGRWCIYCRNICTFATAYLQGRVKIPIGGIVREPEGRIRMQHDGLHSRQEGTSRWNYGTDSDLLKGVTQWQRGGRRVPVQPGPERSPKGKSG